jgi:hypothetical protein
MTSLVTEGLDVRIPHLYNLHKPTIIHSEDCVFRSLVLTSSESGRAGKARKQPGQAAFRRHGDHIGIDRRNNHDAPPA